MNPQDFYDNFRKNKEKGNNFFYGLEQNEPFSSLLFYRESNDQDYKDFEFTKNSLYFPDNICNEIEISGKKLNSDYQKSIKQMIFCVAEQHFFRANTYEFECTLCHKKCSINDKVNHILNFHSKYVSDLLESNCEEMDNDDDFLNGFMTKLEFSSVVTLPKFYYPSLRSELGVCAPLAHEVPETDVDKDNEEDDILKAPNDISVRFQCTLNPVLTKFVSKHCPITPQKEVLPVEEPILIQDQNSAAAGEKEQNTVDAQNQKLEIGGHVQIVDKSGGTLSNDQNIKGKVANKQNNQKVNPKQQTKSAQSQTPDNKPRQPSPNQKVQKDMLSSQALDELDKLYDQSEKNLQGLLHTSKQPQKSSPSLTPYIKTIPKKIRQTIFSRIAKKLIDEFATNQCDKIVKNYFQKKKKEFNLQKKEETKKIRMQKRESVIQKISAQIVVPLLRGFIKSEIESIFKLESTVVPKPIIEIEKIEDEANKVPPPVILSGITSRKHLNPQFLREYFSNYQFQLDEKGKPKIQFRYNVHNRYEVLLFLATTQDVYQMLSNNPLTIECSTITVTPGDKESMNIHLNSYTGQELKIYPNLYSYMKNFDDVSNNGGIIGLISTCPIMCLDSTIGNYSSNNNNISANIKK